jgi:hypothetical protein
MIFGYPGGGGSRIDHFVDSENQMENGCPWYLVRLMVKPDRE